MLSQGRTMLSLFLVLFLSQWVNGQFGQNSACSAPTVTITSPSDVAQITGCSTVSGTILIPSQAAGVIALNGPKEVGAISASNSGETGLTSLTSSSITTIDGSFSLLNLTGLTTLTFSSLSKVKAIDFESVSQLGVITFNSSGVEAGNVTIANLAQLTTLPSFTSSTDQTPSINLNNNGLLKSVNISFSTVADLQIFSNQGLAVTIDSLTEAADISIQNCSSISLSSLKTISGTLDIEYNTFSTFSVPKLGSTIGGSLVLANNAAVTNISLPGVSSIAGSLQVANNTLLGAVGFPDLKNVTGDLQIDGNDALKAVQLPVLATLHGELQVDGNKGLDTIAFPALGIIDGEIDFDGSFTNISLPVLHTASNPKGMSIDSSSNFNCAPLVAYSPNIVVGPVDCQAANSTTATPTASGGGSGSSTPTSAGSATPSPSKTGAASQVALSRESKIGFGVGISVLLFAMH